MQDHNTKSQNSKEEYEINCRMIAGERIPFHKTSIQKEKAPEIRELTVTQSAPYRLTAW